MMLQKSFGRRASRGTAVAAVAAAVLTLVSSVASAANANTCSDWRSAKQQWQADMVTWGNHWGAQQAPGSGNNRDQLLAMNYYDGVWVFQQIGKYLNQPQPWATYAEYARQNYVENYAKANNYNLPGYWRFPHGVYESFKAGTGATREQVEQFRSVPAWSVPSLYAAGSSGKWEIYSREVAYALQAQVLAERAGFPRMVDGGQPIPRTMVRWIPEHFHQWKTGVYPQEEITNNWARYAPFMAALSIHSLADWVDWEEQNGRDPNAGWDSPYWSSIDDMLTDFLDWTYNTALVREGASVGKRLWVELPGGVGTFRYQDRGTDADEIGYTLGNLIGFSYAWAAERAQKRGDTAHAQEFMTVADRLFISATTNSYLMGGTGKFFNQTYRLSFKYLDIKSRTPTLGLCTTRPVAPATTVR